MRAAVVSWRVSHNYQTCLAIFGLEQFEPSVRTTRTIMLPARHGDNSSTTTATTTSTILNGANNSIGSSIIASITTIFVIANFVTVIDNDNNGINNDEDEDENKNGRWLPTLIPLNGSFVNG